jgi:hypothetical protein
MEDLKDDVGYLMYDISDSDSDNENYSTCNNCEREIKFYDDGDELGGGSEYKGMSYHDCCLDELGLLHDNDSDEGRICFGSDSDYSDSDYSDSDSDSDN